MLEFIPQSIVNVNRAFVSTCLIFFALSFSLFFAIDVSSKVIIHQSRSDSSLQQSKTRLDVFFSLFEIKFSSINLWLSHPVLCNFLVQTLQYFQPMKKLPSKVAYLKVVSSRLSRSVAHPSIFRLLMQAKFDAYVL